MNESDPVEEYEAALGELADLSVSVAAQRDQEVVLAALIRLRLAVIRCYGGRRPARRAGGGARGVILRYLQQHVGQWVHGEELAAVSDIGEWARRIRELRVEDGFEIEEAGGRYRLVEIDPDLARRERWQVVGSVQRLPGSELERVRELLYRLVAEVVSVDDLDRVARSPQGSSLARRLREEEGLPVETSVDAADLEAGNVRLASNLEFLGEGQRWYSEEIRGSVFVRDGYRCGVCRLTRAEASGPRAFFLIVRHARATEGAVGSLPSRVTSDLALLSTVCNRCA